ADRLLTTELGPTGARSNGSNGPGGADDRQSTWRKHRNTERRADEQCGRLGTPGRRASGTAWVERRSARGPVRNGPLLSRIARKESLAPALPVGAVAVGRGAGDDGRGADWKWRLGPAGTDHTVHASGTRLPRPPDLPSSDQRWRRGEGGVPRTSRTRCAAGEFSNA